MTADGTLVHERETPPASRTGPTASTAGLAAPASCRTAATDWPPKRLMPWLLAGFMAMVFLIPIDGTELKVHLPVDSKPDRFVIAAMLAVLVVKALLRRRRAPEAPTDTVVTAAVLIFGAFVLFSLLLNVDRIYQLGQLTFAEKALSQVLAYIGFFMIVATQVRKSEVAAYGRLVLGLAVITALGTLYESRTGYNVFYMLGGQLLHPIATVLPSPTTHPTYLEGRKIVVGRPAFSLWRACSRSRCHLRRSGCRRPRRARRSWATC